MRRPDDRPAAGAAAAATDGAALIDDALAQVEAGLDLLASIDLRDVPTPSVTGAVRRLGRLDGRVDGLQARLVAAAEQAGVPERAGATSTTAWLARETGRSGGQAARTARLAKAGEAVPELVDEVAAGTVGPDQAGSLASGLDRDELEAQDVTDLLPAARRLPPRMLSREARHTAGQRRQQRLREQELSAKDERSLTTWRTENGALRFEGLLPPADGDQFEKALSAFYQPDPTDLPDDQRRTHRQRSADALRDLLDASLRAGSAGEVAGALPNLTVLVPWEALTPLATAADTGATGLTDLDTVLSAAEVARLACDATFTRVVLDPEGIPLDVGRTTRKWSGSQRAAITAIDGGCRAPGCELPPHRCVIHHITWWRDGGETSVDNGLLLCRHGHDLIHDDGWTVELDPTSRTATWTAPDGSTHTTHAHGPAAPRTVAPTAAGTGAPTADDTPTTRTRPSWAPSKEVTGPSRRDDTPRPPASRTGRPAGSSDEHCSRDRIGRDPPDADDAVPLHLDV